MGALELRISKDTILYCDTCFTAQALVKLFLDLNEKHAAGVLSTAVCTEDVIHTIELLLSQLTRAPVLELPLRKKIHRLVHVMDPRTTQGDSLLHLVVSKSNSLKSFEDGGQMGNLFPSVSVASMLVECGARINATNALESTPLHTASCLTNFKQEVVELLLRHGAHIDMKNIQGIRPSQLLAANKVSTVSITRFLSLKCLCALVISNNKLPFKGEVPEVLETFIEAH